MSTFPKGANAAVTRVWLDEKGFQDMLIDWDAEALMGSDKSDLLNLIPGEQGIRLWSLLNAARNQSGD
jgi:hypothetical protein